MAIQVQHRRGTQAENDAFTGAAGELIYATDTDRLFMHDGSTQGGMPFPNALDNVNDYYGYASAGGTADALTITVLAPLSAYTTGMEITFKATANNTGSATANVNSLGAKTFKKMSGGALVDLEADDFVNGGIYTARYDGTYLQVLNIAGGAGGAFQLLYTATASASATVDFTLDAGYVKYIAVWNDAEPSVASASLNMRGDFGSGYSAANIYHTEYTYTASGGARSENSTLSTSWLLSHTAGGDTAGAMAGHAEIVPWADYANEMNFFQAYKQSGVAQGNKTRGIGGANATTALTGIRFIFSSGNIDAGNFYLYGIKDS